MKFNGIKKILLLGMILLIIAGAIVIILKGFCVSLMFQQHEALNIYIGKEVNLKDIKTICDEVFQNKQVSLRNIEFFNDSVSINVESMTDEEKANLINKINEKYGTEFNVEEIYIEKVPNVRIRDMLIPYVKPIVISLALIIIYFVIRFRKSNPVKLMGKIALKIVLTEAVLVSLIAIARLPLQPIIINILFTVALVELLICTNKTQKSNVKSEEK